MIEILPPEVTNRIAAGEVVERPASVVRELIDNAIDAGARRITIEVDAGGVDRIRTIDDGCGMDRHDAELAARRHATSKIRTAEDLDRIQSKGFRGEALASIASVSDFELVTRRHGDPFGYRVVSEGGDVVRIEEVGTPAGTRVTVDRLFAKVPARLKFLKRPATELQHITNTVTWAALAHESIHFTLAHNQRTILELPAVPDRLHRVRQVVGDAVANDLVPVSVELPAVILSGFISRPAINRNNTQQLMFFVNDRYIRDRLIHRALMDGYRNMLPPQRYPIAFLYLELDPADVDVNVHPAKQEVRFAHESAVFSAVLAAVRGAWESPSAANTQLEAERTPEPARSFERSPVDRPSASLNSSASRQVFMDGRQSADIMLRPPTANQSRPMTHAPDRWHDGTPVRPPVTDSSTHPESSLPFAEQAGTPAMPVSSSGTGDLLKALQPSSVDRERSLRVCGQLMNSYILAESENGLVIVDQHAAHERIRFEELYAAWKKRQIASQNLLIPETVDLSPGEMTLLEEAIPTLNAFGFEVEPFGPATVSVRSVPQGIKLGDVPILLKDILAGLGDERSQGSDTEDQRAVRALYTVACRSAVKFGDRLTLDEMQAIVDRLATVPRRDVCPHGRPAVLAVKESDLRKAFERG